MRIAIAGLLGAILLFVWGALAHTVLPLGEVGMHPPTDEDAVLASLPAALPKAGIYLMPYASSKDMGDEARMQAWTAKAASKPYAFVIYQPSVSNPGAMGSQLGTQFATDLASCLLLAWLLAKLGGGLLQRVGAGVAVAVIGWLAISAPYWNWYRFPLDFTLANLVGQVVGYGLAALAIGWWLGRARS